MVSCTTADDNDYDADYDDEAVAEAGVMRRTVAAVVAMALLCMRHEF